MMSTIRNSVVVVAIVLIGSRMLPVFAEGDGITFHDFAAMQAAQRVPTGMRITPVVTPAGSIAIGELPRGYSQAPHHHEQEQIMFALSGQIKFSIGGVQHPLGPLQAAIPPANVEHYMIRDGEENPKVLEFQPVARPDWQPPFPAAPQKQTPEPAAVPANVPLTTNLSPIADGWHNDKNGARTKSFSGRTVQVQMWNLSAPTASVELSAAPVQRFVYVFEGTLRVVSGSLNRDVGRDMCIEIAPDAGPVTLGPAASRQAIVGVFGTIGREHRR
jgi:quercetin dioxygenase-like cupin family protein